jgi:hypothetical protein
MPLETSKTLRFASPGRRAAGLEAGKIGEAAKRRPSWTMAMTSPS